MTTEDIKNGKTSAIVAYLTMLGAIIAIFMNMEPKNPFARFHIRQAFGIFLTFFALGFLVSFLNSWPASFGFYIFIFILWGYGFCKCYTRKYRTGTTAGQILSKVV